MHCCCAVQIEQEVKKYKYRDINCVCVYGGGNRREQVNIVTKGVEIVVATPGRLNDLISSNIIDVKSVTYLVLDEADRMLDLGFEPEIRKILIDIRPDRQTIMTSATWPSGVRRLATSYMHNPIRVSDFVALCSIVQFQAVVHINVFCYVLQTGHFWSRKLFKTSGLHAFDGHFELFNCYHMTLCKAQYMLWECCPICLLICHTNINNFSR